MTDATLLSRRALLGSAAGVVGSVALLGTAACAQTPARRYPLMLTDAQWRRRLTPNQYYILRQEGTERPGSSPLNAEHRAGRFDCAGCNQHLFSSTTKFDSGTGWPSFYQPLRGAVVEDTDYSLGMSRTEVECARCGGHLGHVFNDGPRPTGLRYCMNGAAMVFVPGGAV